MERETTKYYLATSFDGTNYHGWQVQPNNLTIQEVLQQVLSQIANEKVVVVGCGRTDSGVHAHRHIAHFIFPKRIEPHTLQMKLNHMLPKDIRAIEMGYAHPDFHARFSKSKKTYRYQIFTGSVLSPFSHRYALMIHGPLNLSRIHTACQDLVGRHDFRGFANHNDKGAAKASPIKTIFEANWKVEGEFHTFTITGSGFLHKMVRNIVGTLIDIGLTKKPLHHIKHLLEIKDRKECSRAAHAKGLFLVDVSYENPFEYSIH